MSNEKKLNPEAVEGVVMPADVKVNPQITKFMHDLQMFEQVTMQRLVAISNLKEKQKENAPRPLEAAQRHYENVEQSHQQAAHAVISAYADVLMQLEAANLRLKLLCQ